MFFVQIRNVSSQTNKLPEPDCAIHFSAWNKTRLQIDRFTTSRFFGITYVAVPLIAGGLIIKGENDHFQELRNAYIPTFHHHYDDYLQYLPVAVMLGMKAGGVEGRSSWGRMLTSDAFSGILMLVTVNTLKSTTKIMRPDGSAKNSFPSGHTATAFMAATMFHKEYGLTRSPFYSIGAYTVATATAISRSMNNKHWMSDILTGAGIGILSTELGYYFADLIFKEDGLLIPERLATSLNHTRTPSFLGIYLGFSIIPGDIRFPGNIRLTTTTGSNAGIEGAWFINRYTGIGGHFSVGNTPVSIDRKLYLPHLPDEGPFSAEMSAFQTHSGYAGPYFSFPLTGHWLLQSKLIAGYSYTRTNNIYFLTSSESGEITRQDILEFHSTGNWGMETGLSLACVVNNGLGVRFFCDYTLSPARLSFHASEDEEPIHIRHTFNLLTLGASVNLLMWRK